MLRLLGYTDRLSAAPGDTIRFMVSSDHDRYASRLVRLIHGDTNPAGPGFKQVLVPSTIDGVRPGRHQDLPSGSSATLPVPAGELDCGLHVRGLRPAHGAGRARGGHREPRSSVRWRRLGAACVRRGHARGGHRASRDADADRDGDRVAAVALVLRGADGRGRGCGGEPPARGATRARTPGWPPTARRPAAARSPTTRTRWSSRRRSTATGGRGTSTVGSTGRG